MKIETIDYYWIDNNGLIFSNKIRTSSPYYIRHDKDTVKIREIEAMGYYTETYSRSYEKVRSNRIKELAAQIKPLQEEYHRLKAAETYDKYIKLNQK